MRGNAGGLRKHLTVSSAPQDGGPHQSWAGRGRERGPRHQVAAAPDPPAPGGAGDPLPRHAPGERGKGLRGWGGMAVLEALLRPWTSLRGTQGQMIGGQSAMTGRGKEAVTGAQEASRHGCPGRTVVEHVVDIPPGAQPGLGPSPSRGTSIWLSDSTRGFHTGR